MQPSKVVTEPANLKCIIGQELISRLIFKKDWLTQAQDSYLKKDLNLMKLHYCVPLLASNMFSHFAVQFMLQFVFLMLLESRSCQLHA
jgi:hypothetical protein